MEILSLTFLFSGLSFFLILICYPFLVYIKLIFRNNKIKKSDSFLMPVSIIISCYNEEEYIREKIVSIIKESEWIPGSELIIVSCGVTDNTNNILEEFFDNEKLVIVIIHERLSKIDGVNLAVAKSKNEILVFSDCRQNTKSGSIKQLVHNFNDPSIGTVTGSLVDTKNTTKQSFFRSLFNSMAIKESSVSSSLNVYGALYAQRKSVFREIPRDLLFDDLFVVVSTLSQKKRLIQDEHAIIYDVNFNDYYQGERIARLVRGLLIFLSNHTKLIISLPIGVLLRFIYFKYLKLLMPFFLVLLLFGAVTFLILCQNLYLYIGVLTAIIALLFNVQSREFLTLFVKINYYFMTSTLFYLFGIKRSNNWEKLHIKSRK